MSETSMSTAKQVLLHGTTARRAQIIVASQQFAGHEPLYVVFDKHRDLAEIFAIRKARRERDQPRLLEIVVESEESEALRKRGDARLIPFDADDHPQLRSRNQWVISPAGVQVLNLRLVSIDVQLMHRS